MSAWIETRGGRLVLVVEYDPGLLNWNEAIAAGYAALGLRPGQIHVIARPADGQVVADRRHEQDQLFKDAGVLNGL